MNLKWKKYILEFLNKYISKIVIDGQNNINIYIKNVKYLYILVNILKKHTLFKLNILVDIICIDLFKRNFRFELCYSLLSIDFGFRINLFLNLDNSNIVQSLISVFHNANWMEREVFDLYGIFFNKHTDLRRILTDYGFIGYPFRKDFPINGFFEIRYDENKQFLIYENIELMQKMRYYDFLKPYNKILI